MEQTRGNLDRHQADKYHFTDSIPIEIHREFDAPVERVWAAWTTPEMIKQWWGPETYSSPEAKIDFRERGKYNFAMQGPDQKIVWSGGVFEEIIPLKKIVYTDQFTNKDGQAVSAKEYGMPGEWPEAGFVVLTFEKTDKDGTKMSLEHYGIPSSMHDDCIMGWNSSLDKMQKLVERS